MKVVVRVVVDIDPDAWQANYGISGATEIREDVKQYVTHGVVEHLRELGLLSEGS